jgi:hypothetical protein
MRRLNQMLEEESRAGPRDLSELVEEERRAGLSEVRALKEKWLTKRELHLIVEKSQGVDNIMTMHSPFPAGGKLSKLVAKGKDMIDNAQSEDSSLLADAKSAGYNVTRVKLVDAESEGHNN